jgi:hypothetical protein
VHEAEATSLSLVDERDSTKSTFFQDFFQRLTEQGRLALEDQGGVGFSVDQAGRPWLVEPRLGAPKAAPQQMMIFERATESRTLSSIALRLLAGAGNERSCRLAERL